MKTKLTVQGREYEIEIIDRGPDGVVVVVGGKEFTYPGEGIDAAQTTAPKASLPRRDFSEKNVRAALAGAVTEIFVVPGQVVAAGQKLLTLSAMKMENEIVAEAEGKIKEIKVAKDQKVKEGDVLITLA